MRKAKCYGKYDLEEYTIEDKMVKDGNCKEPKALLHLKTKHSD